MTIFNKKKSNYKFFTTFVIINLGMDPDPDWFRILRQAGYGSGFSEYRYGSETMVSFMVSSIKSSYSVLLILSY
jgi:hypothetical protein